MKAEKFGLESSRKKNNKRGNGKEDGSRRANIGRELLAQAGAWACTRTRHARVRSRSAQLATNALWGPERVSRARWPIFLKFQKNWVYLGHFLIDFGSQKIF